MQDRSKSEYFFFSRFVVVNKLFQNEHTQNFSYIYAFYMHDMQTIWLKIKKNDAQTKIKEEHNDEMQFLS